MTESFQKTRVILVRKFRHYAKEKIYIILKLKNHTSLPPLALLSLGSTVREVIVNTTPTLHSVTSGSFSCVRNN